jgi:TRAP-type C4-dicarboxylate transport system substrate-binding protein
MKKPESPMLATSRRSPRTFKWAAVASAATLALTLTSCAEDSASEGANGGGDAVEYGASKEDYQNALADMEPVTLVMQSTAPKGAPTGRRFEQYAAEVEDWSGGKITFDIAYSSSIAPPDQVDDAIADGRIDVGSVMASLEPDKFKSMAALMDLTFLGRQGPVDGVLQFHGAMAESAFASEEINQEFADNGLRLLLPIFSSGPSIMACTEPVSDLASLEGRTVATQSRLQSEQAEALGMSTASVSYAEMFEALERGVVDCVDSTLATSNLSGFIPAAPYFVMDYNVGLGNAGGAISMSQSRWEELPLAAQQLLTDRVDVVLKENIYGIWENMVASMDQIEKAGGSIVQFDAESAAAIKVVNDQQVEDARSNAALGDANAFVDDLLASEDEWAADLAKLDTETDTPYEDFLTEFEPETFDMDAYLELVWERAFLPYRP